MTARDRHGKFVNADHAAAERVIEAAVREAVTLLRRGLYRAEVVSWDGEKLLPSIVRVEADHRHLATQVLAHAGHAASLLLDGGAK